MSVDILPFSSDPKKISSRKDPAVYEKLAMEFLKDRFYRFHQGKILAYEASQRKYLPVEDLTLSVARWMISKDYHPNNAVLGNVCTIIRAIAYCDSRDYPYLPFWYGVPGARSDLIAFNNGLLDLGAFLEDKISLIEHSPDWVSTSCLPFDFDPGASCTRWLEFLDQTFEGDPERISLLQEWFGYLLTPDASRQKFMVMVGLSRSGKGTIQYILERLLGDGSHTAYDLESLASSFGLGSLVGKSAAFVGEVNLANNWKKLAIMSKLNSITGDDPVEIEYKHVAQKYSIRLFVRFMISCNRFPVFPDSSGAMLGRMLVLTFERSLPANQQDINLRHRLAAELSGIAFWALQGLVRLNRYGFTVPGKSSQKMTEISREANPAFGFMKDRLIVSKALDTGNLPGVEIVENDAISVSKQDVLEAYSLWCRDLDAFGSDYYFSKDLKVILPKLTDFRPHGQPRRWLGISLKKGS